MNAPILFRNVPLADLRGPKTVEVTATPEQRAALAKECDLLDVSHLTAMVTLTPEADGAVSVAGLVTANIEQACVVTLDPVPQRIDEPFAVRFVRPGSPELPLPARPHDEVVVDPAAPDPPEVLSGNAIDLGPLIEETFLLAIDPYPRSPGAMLAQEPADGNQSDSPFAVLAGLKPPKK